MPCHANRRRRMQIRVLVQRVKGNGDRARANVPFAVSSKRITREEGVAKLRAKIQIRLMSGTEFVHLEVGKLGLQIAATAREHGGTVVTRNVQDFKDLPGLRVEDWST